MSPLLERLRTLAKTLFENEAAVAIGTVTSTVTMLVSFGVIDVTPDQLESIQSWLLGLAPLVTGWIVREFVWSKASVDQEVEDARRGTTPQ